MGTQTVPILAELPDIIFIDCSPINFYFIGGVMP